jgi:hypothetical protein
MFWKSRRFDLEAESRTLYTGRMKRKGWRHIASVVLCVAVAGCGKSAGDSRSKWLEAKLVPTAVEAKGVKVHVDIPQGLPENKESLVGPDWHVELGEAGPRVTIQLRERAFKTPEELARDVEPDAKRADLVEVSKQALAGGRLQYVSAVKGNRHLDVAVWIPVDETHGLQASCHWYAGSSSKDMSSPDAQLIGWLTKICDSVQPGG